MSGTAPAITVTLTEGPLAPASPARGHEGGAVLVFEGLVRAEEKGQIIEALEYEQYPPMTENELTALAESIARRHNLIALQCDHSVGRVVVGECSFRLTIVGKHRKESLAATDEFIDTMKKNVPIWKRPVFL